MKILARSVFDSFLTAFLLSFIVISAVLTLGLLMPLAGYFMKGAGLTYLLRFVAIGFHEALQLTVPIALFFASVFVFARLREDGELDAMRACGLRLWSIAAWPLVLAVILSGFFIWVNGSLIPREHSLRRQLKAALFVSDGFKLVEPGETMDAISGLRLRFDGREGDTLLGLQVNDSSDPKVSRFLTAARAKMDIKPSRQSFEFEDMTMEPLDAAKTLRLRAGYFRYRLKKDLRTFRYLGTVKDLPLFELPDNARRHDARARALDALATDRVRADAAQYAMNRKARHHVAVQAAAARIEFNRRIVYALAPFCFVFFGIALGARVRRGGLVRAAAWGLAMLLAYYLVVLAAVALEDLPALHPEWFVCLPPIVTLAIGWRLWRGL